MQGNSLKPSTLFFLEGGGGGLGLRLTGKIIMPASIDSLGFQQVAV